jgi:hypothetical protein
VSKIAKHLVVCLFALSVPAYLMRDHPDDFPVLIPVGLIVFLTLMFVDSPRAISWARDRIKALSVSGVCVALVGFLLTVVMGLNGVSEFVLAFPTIGAVIGIWMFTTASVVKTFHTR